MLGFGFARGIAVTPDGCVSEAALEQPLVQFDGSREARTDTSKGPSSLQMKGRRPGIPSKEMLFQWHGCLGSSLIWGGSSPNRFTVGGRQRRALSVQL